MKLLIADDHSVVREGLKQIIRSLDANSLIEEASEGIMAHSKIEEGEYDLVILDISMPSKSGLEVLQAMIDTHNKTPVLMLSIHPQEQYAIRAMKLGAMGYLCKDSLFEELAAAIKTILAGKRYISSTLAEKILFDKIDNPTLLPHERLSAREFQIMCMIARGVSLKEISEKLFISDKTVSTHRIRIMEKMGLTKNAELTNYSIKNNLIE
jgi:two-component system, NarL family, invasion response regulator UvrY